MGNRFVKPDGLTIGELRQAKGWSQLDLARKAGINKKTIERIESKPGHLCLPSKLHDIAAALDACYEDLLAKESTTDSPTDKVFGESSARPPAGVNALRLIAYAGSVLFFVAANSTLAETIEVLMGQRAPGLVKLLSATPLLLLVFVDALPAIRRRRRISRLARLGRNGDPVRPGYFRAQPWTGSAEDVKQFTRPDDAHLRILDWIERADSPILYLSGDSGSGKTSLLNAFVMPQLDKSETEVLTVRCLDSPLDMLEEALEKRRGNRGLPLHQRTLREKVEEFVQRLKGGRLLVVLDQFEEFLIFRDRLADQGRSTQSFLRDLEAQPIGRVQLLIVFRKDYLGQLSQLGLPPLRQDVNWKEVGSFTLEASRRFLENSGIAFESGQVVDSLKQAMELDATPGLIRPITLNLTGLALCAQPIRASKPTFLGQYLKGCIDDKHVAHIAPEILRRMITPEATKAPQTIEALSRGSGFTEESVSGCLLQLSVKGLVRSLDRGNKRWEISHDFIALLLYPLVRGWRTGFYAALRQWAAPSSLVFSILVIFLALPSLAEQRELRAVQALSHLGALIRESEDGLEIEFPEIRANANTLERSIPELSRLVRLYKLTLRGERSLSIDLDPLRGLTRLKALEISFAQPVDLSPLATLSELHSLRLSGCGVGDIAPILRLVRLEALDLQNNPFADLTGIGSLGRLQKLVLDGTQVADLAPLRALSALRELHLARTRVSNIDWIAGLDRLEVLSLDSSPVSDLTTVGRFGSLRRLVLRGTAVRAIDPVSELKKLETLDLSHTQVSELKPLAGLSRLRRLNLSNTSVADLGPLEGLLQLQELNLLGAVGVKDLAPLRSLSNLYVLDLNGTQVEELEPLTELRRLKRVYLSRAPVRDVTPLSGKHLWVLDLSYTSVVDLSPLSAVQGLEVLYISGTKVSDLTPLIEMRNLKDLYASETEFPLKKQAELLKGFRPEISIWGLERFGYDERRRDIKPKKLIPVPPTAVGIGFNGEHVWVSSSSGSLTKIDARTGMVVATIPLESPGGNMISDGAFLWMTRFFLNQVVKLRLSDGRIAAVYSVGKRPRGLVFDGESVWVAIDNEDSVTKIRARDGRIVGTYRVGDQPTQVSFDGDHVWVVNSGDGTVSKLAAANGAHLGTYKVGGYPVDIGFDGTDLWVSLPNQDELIKIRPSDGRVLGRYPVDSPYLMTLDGIYLWVTNPQANSLTKVRIADGAITDSIPVGRNPAAMIFDGANVWVVNQDDHTVGRY